MLRNWRDGSTVAPWILIIVAAVVCGCSQPGPAPKYTDLSRKVHDVVTRTQGDPSKMTPADRLVMSDAKSYKMMTPPGY